MKNKILYLLIFIILCVGFYFLGTTMSNKTPIRLSDTARLMEDGSSVKVFTGETKGRLGVEFVFTDNQNNIINTLSVENSNIAGPSYRIVKGDKHDWLVITTIGKNGTGYIEYVDTWYMVTGWYGGIQKVLSYNSLVKENDTLSSKEITSDVMSNNVDDILDVKFTTKICKPKDVCTTSSQIDRYVRNVDKLDESKSGFILKY